MPEELAGIAVFLGSGTSDFITGAAIPIDGRFSVPNMGSVAGGALGLDNIAWREVK